MDRIYVVQKHWGVDGCEQHYSHADVVAENEWEAICKAMEDEVQWRRVDNFDVATRTFVNFSVVASYDA